MPTDADLSAKAPDIPGTKNPIENRRSSVPRHTEIDDMLILKICKDLGIPRP